MQIPVDVKAVIDEAMNIESARQTSLSVAIYIDESAPGDLQAHVRLAFASASSHARVSSVYFPQFPVYAVEADMAVIVAGFNENIGSYASEIRKSGVPVMIVTSMPELVCAISRETGSVLLKEDLLSPFEPQNKQLLPKKGGKEAPALEPIMLTPECSRLLLKRMGEWVIEACKEKRLAFALAFSFVRKPLSLEAVRATSLQNAGIGLVVFLPGADMPIMTLNQAKMLLQIAAAYGQPMSPARVKELALVVGGAFALRSTARQLVAFIPALGWALKAAIGYTGTYAMGQAAIEYFERGGSIKGLAGVVNKTRECVMKTAGVLYKQPQVKAVVKSATAHTSQVLSTAAKKLVPAAGSLIGSAIASGISTDPLSKKAVGKVRASTNVVLKRSR